MSESHLKAAPWDVEYRNRRYADDPPLRFVAHIVETLRADASAWGGTGTRRTPTDPSAAPDLRGLPTFESSRPAFDYVIALQVFQHGAEADVTTYFTRVAALVRPGGLFFLRVNSASTQIYHAHTVVERNTMGGLTIRYDDGPKRGLLIHFFS